MEIQGFQCVRVQQGFVGVGELSLVQTFYLLDGVEITIQNHLHSSELNRRKGYVVNRVNASVKVVIQLTEITTSYGCCLYAVFFFVMHCQIVSSNRSILK